MSFLNGVKDVASDVFNKSKEHFQNNSVIGRMIHKDENFFEATGNSFVENIKDGTFLIGAAGRLGKDIAESIFNKD